MKLLVLPLVLLLSACTTVPVTAKFPQDSGAPNIFLSIFSNFNKGFYALDLHLESPVLKIITTGCNYMKMLAGALKKSLVEIRLRKNR